MALTNLNSFLTNLTGENAALVAKLQEVAAALNAKIKISDLLDGNGKVLASKLPFALTDLLVNKGGFDATTDDLGTIQGTAQEGWLYVVTTGGNIDNSVVQTGVTSVTAGDILWFVDGGWVHIKSAAVAPGIASSVLLDNTVSGFTATTVMAYIVEAAARIVALETDLSELNTALGTLATDFANTTVAINAITVA